MSAETAINVTYAAVILLAGIALVRLSTRRRPSASARVAAACASVARPAEDYVGPDSLRLLQDLDAHLDQHFTQLAGLYERVGPPTFDLDAGCDRLRQAIRDEQNGDQL